MHVFARRVAGSLVFNTKPSPLLCLRLPRISRFQPHNLHLQLTAFSRYSTMSVPSHLLADEKAPVCRLEIQPHFDNLSAKEKLYAHHISKASFAGTRVVLRQVSPESEPLFDLILTVARHVENDFSKIVEACNVTEDEKNKFAEFGAQVLANLGNYKSFGDQKFVPRIPEETFTKIASITPEAAKLWEGIKKQVYQISPEGITLLGYPPDHMSAYYPDSPAITQADIEACGETFVKNGVLVEHTRLKQLDDGSFDMLVASEKVGEGSVYETKDGRKIRTVYGDHSKEMKVMADELDGAKKAALNDTQEKMMEEYVKSFREGSLEAHKESQRYWIKDIGPTIETNIGFIETYRDPAGTKAYFEGWVAVVNKERTKVFGKLVERAGDFIPKLPWSKDFEKDKFQKPDFTSLEVLTFNSDGIPAGINIPNYDDIRMTLGFKNVSLGNVLNAKSPSEKVTFIDEKDLPLFERLRGPAFELQVGLHELLGHGSGKLLQETEKGVFNFDKENPPVSPLTGKPVTTYYKVGETWGSVFGATAASYEECRAECVAMYLCPDREILEVFGHTDDTEAAAEDVLYISYLQMARAGLLALEFWDPKTKKWGQAHMRARYSILQCFLSAPDNFVSLDSTTEDHSDLTIHLDRSKIRSHGFKAVEKYLQELHIYKASADVNGGVALYDKMTSVNDTMAKFRDVVMSKKQPRKQFVQANTTLNGDEVTIKEYEATQQGLIQSWLDREDIVGAPPQ
ncbi:hypothetical protein TWF102_005490 [Orbilia oligospora]|uniref:Dipeptidyl peptidase 3 n=1 Tax=Orbilia oligospora TaxID=2813651 RepID=A0A7C8J793_ORBOL|nr:hypothetical protein TWF103_002614 [Orbilia oligospora]KAF3099518.1 hypothetical protein TWF102_005490 [Orbilia oligospora]